MLCQHEHGVLAGSDFFLPTLSDAARQLYYYTSICGHYHCETGYQIERDTASSYLLMAVAQGRLAVGVADCRVEARAGDIVLLDCYQPHWYAAQSYLEFSWLHVEGANSRALCDALTGGTGISVTQAPYADVHALLYQLLSRFRNQQRVSEPMCARSIYSMLCCLMPNASLSAPAGDLDTPAGRAMAYIQEHLGEALSLGRLAALAGLSPYHFTRVFKKATGYTPYEYIILTRIDQAKYLLKNSSLSIKEIGAKVGYRTEISFISAFSQKVGISPGRFRKFPLG